MCPKYNFKARQASSFEMLMPSFSIFLLLFELIMVLKPNSLKKVVQNISS